VAARGAALTTGLTRKAGTVSPSHVTTWNLDPAHSIVEFAVEHLGIALVRGHFTKFRAAVTLDEADPAGSAMEATIDAASVDTRDEKRDAHIRSAEFFDTERFPDITFRSTKVTRDGAKYRVTGDFTIRGTQREIILDARDQGRGRDPWGGERIGFRATTKVDRRQWGLVWNVEPQEGGSLLANDVAILLEGELVKS